MRIDVFAEDGDKKEKLATFTVKGIDQAASSDVAKQEGSSQPKVTLGFELSRSGLIQLNKAEAKIEETYTVEERVPAKASKSRILNTTKDNSTESTDAANETNDDNTTGADDSEPKAVKKTKKRTVPFPLTNVERQFYGIRTLTQEQMKACRERLRAYEKRDEDKAKTDKAKNDFESVIYALRDWVNEDDNMPFIGNADK
jgi:hypoxia up-regulated 1